MRSAVLLGLVVLSGCEEKPPKQVTTVSIKGPPPPEQESAGSATKSVTKIERHYQALGTEPFWSVEVMPEALVYKTPENLAGIRITYTMKKVARDTRYFGKLGGEQVILLIMPAKCSDGMSDTVYPYSATWSIGTEIHGGCARLK